MIYYCHYSLYFNNNKKKNNKSFNQLISLAINHPRQPYEGFVFSQFGHARYLGSIYEPFNFIHPTKKIKIYKLIFSTFFLFIFFKLMGRPFSLVVDTSPSELTFGLNNKKLEKLMNFLSSVAEMVIFFFFF